MEKSQIIYILNNEESKLTFNYSNKLKDLKKLINISQKVDFSDHFIFYNNKNISNLDEEKIRDIISNTNQTPMFFIKKKDFSLVNLFTQPKLRNYVSLKGFPSRPDIISTIESFFNAYYLSSQEYAIINKSDSIEIEFKDKSYNEIFIKYMNRIKYRKQTYINLKISSSEDNNRDEEISESYQSTKNKETDLNTCTKEKKFRRNPRKNLTELPQIKPNIILEKTEISENEPYLSPEEKRKLSIKENKKKWINKNDFNKYGGKKLDNKSPALFVNLDKFINSPLNYQFRSVEKKNWLSNRNFYG